MHFANPTSCLDLKERYTSNPQKVLGLILSTTIGAIVGVHLFGQIQTKWRWCLRFKVRRRDSCNDFAEAGLTCFSRKNRKEARNILDTRWVLKWKWELPTMVNALASGSEHGRRGLVGLPALGVLDVNVEGARGLLANCQLDHCVIYNNHIM